MKYKTHFILMSLLLSITACGGGGGGTPPASNPDPDPDPAPTTPTGFTSVIDTGWNEVNRSPIINKAIYTGSKYLAVGDSGYIAESTDGTNWTEFKIKSPLKLVDVASNGTSAVAIARENSWIGYAATSDGINWQIYKDEVGLDCFNLQSVIHDGSQFVAIDNGTNICTSTDAVSWTKQSTQAANMSKLAYGGGKYVFSLGDGIIVKTALDSTAMTVATLPSNTIIGALMSGGSTFIAQTGVGLIYSTDGANWSAAESSGAALSVYALTYSSARGFTAYSDSVIGRMVTSADGVSWSAVVGGTSPISDSDIYEYTDLLANGASETLLFGRDGSVFSSTNLTSWVSTVGGKPMNKIASYINQGGNQYVAMGDIETGSSGFFVSSDNGSNWNARSVPVGTIASVIYDGTGYVASGSLGLAYSADGINWGDNSDFSYGSGTLVASAKLGATTYYFSSYSAVNNQVLTSVDGVDFAVDTAMATAITNSAGGIVGVFEQAVSNGSVLVARTPRSIVVYDGSSWSVAVTNTASDMNDIIVSGSEFVVVGDAGIVMTSSNGVDWASQTWINAGAYVRVLDVMDVAGTLYAVDILGTLASSADGGVSWALVKDFSTASNSIQELAYDASNTTFYAFGMNTSLNSPVLRTSTNVGVTWGGGSVLERPAAHVFYDSANARFVDYRGNESANGSSWSVASQYPDDVSFAYKRAATALTNVRAYGPINFTAGTPDTYTAGKAYSEDGQNWILKTDQFVYQGYTPLSGVYANGIGYTSTDGINFSLGTVSGLFNNTAGNTGKPLAYANGQYIIRTATNGSGGAGIYASSDGLSWTLQTNLATDYYNAWSGVIDDIEYDGSQYLMLTNNEVKGVMIVTSTDLQTFTVHETGILTKATDLILDANGYAIIGEEGLVVTHASY